MKKLLFSAAAMALAFFAASCQQENLEPTSGANTVTYTVQVPDAIATKAIGDDFNGVDKVYYEVYRKAEIENGQPVYEGSADVDANGKASFSLEFVKEQNYIVLFWAQNSNLVQNENNVNGMYNIDNLRAVKLVNPGAANNESAQVFAKKDEVSNCTSAANGNVILTRPVSQINVFTTKESLNLRGSQISLVKSSMTVSGMYNTYNVAAGAAVAEVENEATYVYTSNGVPTADADNADLKYVAMNYVGFAYGENTIVNVDFRIKTSENEVDGIPHSVSNVPVKPNYRTNIIGNLITGAADYNITLNKDWGTPEEVISVWNGTDITEPTYNEDTKTYVASNASDLAWLAAAVNGTLPESKSNVANSFAGKTFVLTSDMDLGGQEWTPIGTKANPFKGTFDGNGKTIKNLVVNGGSESNKGLFGYTIDGEIKNFTVENAKVSGRLNVGVVAGTPYTSKYTDITVTGHVEVDGLAYVGGVGGKDAYADWTKITVNVDETSYVKAHSIDNGNAYRTYVGGVVGFNGEGGHKFSNITSNINVKGSTCDVGGLFGIAHYNNQFVNCKCTGKVEIYAAEEADEALEIGGIAGVWHNEDGTSVTFTDCLFDGSLTTNIEGVKFHNAGLVGKPYSDTGKGKLIIDGVQYVASAAELQAALDAATGETTLKLGLDIVGDVTVVQKQGVKITIDGNDHKFNGSIKVHGNSNHYADAALTIKNVDFETSTTYPDSKGNPCFNFIEALENGSLRYSANITAENCTFTASGDAADLAVGLQIKSSKWAKVLNCTATNMHSLIQAQSCDATVVVNGCQINGKNGVAFKQVKAATVEGTTIVASEYGIRFDGNTDNYGIVVKNNTVTANQPFIVRKMTGKNNTIVLEGTNTLTTETKYQIVITNGSDDEAYVKPTGTYTLTCTEGYAIFPVQPKEIFADNNWDAIIEACAGNSVPESWKVGDKKKMTIGGQEYQIAIIGKNHDDYTAGGKAPLTFQVAEVCGTAKMNATQTNTTGWSGSAMRNTTMPEIFKTMPSYVQDAIKEVKKETLNGSRDGLETTSDKLFLLSEVEVNGSVYFSNNFAEGSRYAYYTDLNSMIMNSNGKPATWWLRGPGKSNAIGYTQIIQSGYMANGSAEYACGVVFGFCF